MDGRMVSIISRARDVNKVEIGEHAIVILRVANYVICSFMHLQRSFLSDRHHYISYAITTDAKFQKFLIWIKHKGV